MGRRPNGSPEAPVRSVRITDPLWAKAKMRADHDGVTMSEVLSSFVKGYADGYLDLPQVQVVYKSTVK